MSAEKTSIQYTALGLPIGEALPNWRPAPRPPRSPMTGRFCQVEPLDIEAHAEALYTAFREDREDRIWTYLAYGPFPDFESFLAWLKASCLGEDPLFHAICERESGRPLGLASYLRIDPPNGVIEVGHINFAPALQRTPAASEAMYIMMRRVFAELGYRRYEWKCDSLNARSRRAATRLGFTFEGEFRQATVYKQRNRDTAWYSILDREWPQLDIAYREWLEGVGEAGRVPGEHSRGESQKESLGSVIARHMRPAG